jgi:hypothetical protein
MSFTDDIIAFENGDQSDLQTLELFAHLIKTGQAWSLQGVYGRSANALIGDGLITPQGVITDEAYDRLGAQPETPTEPEVDPHNDWGISQQRIEAHFAEAATKLATNDRTYVVGIPLAVTVQPDGTIVLDFDLCEAYEFEPCDEGADQGVLRDDSNTVSHRLQHLRNHHRLTLPPTTIRSHA